ncbi:DUF1576 domain-containing protein [uncultured Sphaerochaeta sp.]|uniref:DUF1576 domain-containing protein n=1 Tax=uncultured Sphaerochaeta sp. TaxID=886478 RepID=UPI0029C9C14B|nr:DUF1576 domain-containing protein [uncultured Sphaerochaeta sp.]
MERSERILYALLIVLICSLMLIAMILEGPLTVLQNTLRLQTQAARLISDFTLHGVGTAMFNAATVGLLAMVLIFNASVSLSGPTISAILTMMGFSFFGNTLLNSIPLIAGVWLASKLARKTFGSYSLIALFGTALGPLVTFLMFSTDLPLPLSIPLGIVAGLAAGFILPAVAGSMLQLHQGYNLYNVGFSCGFIGLFASNLLIAAGQMEPLAITWSEEFSLPLFLVIPMFSLLLIVTAFFIEKPKQGFQGLLEVQKLSGRLPYDFFDTGYTSGTLLNIGLLGLVFWAYLILIGAPINGPTIGALFTIIAFGGFGKTLKNTFPVVLGVILSTLLFGKSLVAPGPLLATLFATTLAPIAGQFGFIAGLLAGFLHLVMVEVTASWHGGLDLYNNGFAGGLTASLFVAILQWYKTNRPEEDFIQ